MVVVLCVRSLVRSRGHGLRYAMPACGLRAVWSAPSARLPYRADRIVSHSRATRPAATTPRLLESRNTHSSPPLSQTHAQRLLPITRTLIPQRSARHQQQASRPDAHRSDRSFAARGRGPAGPEALTAFFGQSPATCVVGLRQTERPNEVRRSGASARDPLTIPTSVGRTRSTATAPGDGIAAPQAVRGFGDPRVALSHLALVSAPSQQSFSRASCPILAWRTLRSDASDKLFVVPPNPSTARVSTCGFRSVIGVGARPPVSPTPSASSRPRTLPRPPGS